MSLWAAYFAASNPTPRWTYREVDLKVLRPVFQIVAEVAMLAGQWLTFSLLIFCVSPNPTAAQDKCPTVSQVEGSWEPKVRNGQEVCVGTVLRAKKDASITIEFKEKNLKVKKSCVIELGCEIPVLGPGGNAAEQGIVDRVFAAFARKRLSLEDGTVLAVSRGLEPELKDCVVSLHETQVDLSPAFKEMKPGRYWVRLQSLPKSGPWRGPFEVQWTGRSATVRVTELTTGLHELTLVEKTGEPAGSECLILATNRDAYENESSSFHNAVELSQKWTDESDPIAVRILLRAYLESLGDAKSLVRSP